MAERSGLSVLRDAMGSLNATGARGFLLGALVLAIIVPELLGGDALRLAWRFDRKAIEAGEGWRLFSAHFVHLDRPHALANAAGAVLIWALVGTAFGAGRWLQVVAASLAGTTLGLWFLEPGLGWYVGASGFLHGLLVAGALRNALAADPLSRIVLGVVIVKLCWEQLVGPMSTAGEGVNVVVGAHLYGALGGAVSALADRARSGPRTSPTS